MFIETVSVLSNEKKNGKKKEKNNDDQKDKESGDEPKHSIKHIVDGVEIIEEGSSEK